MQRAGILEKTFLGSEAGYIGLFIDTEGNRIGFQNMYMICKDNTQFIAR